MNRRDFTKDCASAALTAIVLKRTAVAKNLQLHAEGAPAGEAVLEKSADAYARREGMTWILERPGRNEGLLYATAISYWPH